MPINSSSAYVSFIICSFIEQAAGEVGLHRLNQPARCLRIQIALDGVGSGDHAELVGSAAIMFVEMNGSKRRFAFESRQLQSPSRVLRAPGAIGCAKVESDCFPKTFPSCRRDAGALRAMRSANPNLQSNTGKKFLKPKR